MEREFASQRLRVRAPEHAGHEREALLAKIAATPPGQARQQLLEHYAAAVQGLEPEAEKQALTRANAILGTSAASEVAP
jgi:hypothetical protein